MGYVAANGVYVETPTPLLRLDDPASVSSSYNASPKGVAARIRNGMNAARNNNPWDLGEDTTPAAPTWNTDTPASIITRDSLGAGYFTEYTMRQLLDSGSVRIGGAPADFSGGFITDSSATSPASIQINTTHALDGGRLGANGGAHISFKTESQYVFFRTFPFAVGVRTFVDGKYYYSIDGVATTGANAYVFHDFHLLARRERIITLEVAQGAYNIGLAVEKNTTITAAPPYPASILIVTDSYGAGKFSGNAGGADATDLSATANNTRTGEGVLGALRCISGCNFIANAAQGTGVLVSASGVGPFGDPKRMADIPLAKTDCTFLVLSCNDYESNVTPYDTGTTAYRDALVSFIKNFRDATTQPLVIFGPPAEKYNDTSAPTTNQAKLKSMETAAADAIRISGAANVALVPWCQGGSVGGRYVSPMIVGANYQNNGGAANAGNSYYLVGLDGRHLTPRMGTEYWARGLLNLGVAALESM